MKVGVDVRAIVSFTLRFKVDVKAIVSFTARIKVTLRLLFLLQ